MSCSSVPRRLLASHFKPVPSLAHDNALGTFLVVTTMVSAPEDALRRRSIAVPPGSASPSQQEVRKKRKRKRPNEAEPPFYVLFLQVGTTLLILVWALHGSYRWVVPAALAPDLGEDSYDDDVAMPVEIHEQDRNVGPLRLKMTDLLTNAHPEPHDEQPTIPALPTWNLTAESNFDAYALAERFHTNSTVNTLFWQTAAGLRRQFAKLYGGENSARALLTRGLSIFGASLITNDSISSLPSDLRWTACRIQSARIEKRPFRFAFGGYSVTVGRGNLFRQSFPLVMEKLLHTSFLTLDVDLQVNNAAIGGCPAFPYGWCMKNFWGEEPDVVSWDFAMNEAGGDPRGMEAYLRHLWQLPRQPKVIVKDTFMATDRRLLLQTYVQQHNILHDPVVVHTEPAVRPFLDRPEHSRPEGFRSWREFGSPLGAPGQALHHPAVKEHELIAWLLTMHFLSALQVVATSDEVSNLLQCPTPNPNYLVPPPQTLMANNSTDVWNTLMYGRPSHTGFWLMNQVQCRTTFEPIVDGDLSSIIVSGSEGESLDVMLPKSKMYYNRGWVLDLSDGEKQAKRKLNIFGGLGFLDSKKAYYGLKSSGILRFLLPYEISGSSNNTLISQQKVGDRAKDWFQSVTICQVNERREGGACNAEQDLHLTLGGLNITNASMIDAARTLYLGKKLCVYLPVPETALLTSRKVLTANETPDLVFVDNVDEERENRVGLALEVSIINNHIIRREQACSVSHVVWEQHWAASPLSESLRAASSIDF